MSTPKPPMLNQSLALMKLESSFLDFQGKCRLAATCNTWSSVFKDPSLKTLLEQAKKAAALLNLVLNIDENGKKEILEIITANPEFILFKSQGRVKYFSSKQNKIIGRLEISHLTPLEAAAFSGDFHLVNVFRDALPENQKHQAGLQLEAILSRCDFLSAFHSLQKTYHEYLSRYNVLCKTLEGNLTLAELRENICQAQKKLSLFGMQVFCNPIDHRSRNLLDVTKEPLRASELAINEANNYLDLDAHGKDGTLGMLFRGRWYCARAERNNLWVGGVGGHKRRSLIQFDIVKLDSEMIDRLCKVIPDELGITKTLLLQYKQAESAVEKPVSSSSPDLSSATPASATL